MSPDKQGQRKGAQGPPLVSAGRYMGYGLNWAMSTALFLVGGLVVDRWLGTTPLLTIIGAFVGAAAGFYSLYHHLVVLPRRAAGDGARELRGGGTLLRVDRPDEIDEERE